MRQTPIGNAGPRCGAGMRPKNARHEDLCCIEGGRRAPGDAHGIAYRLDALTLGLRELELRKKPCERLVAPAGCYLALAQVVQGHAGRQGAGRGELDAISFSRLAVNPLRTSSGNPCSSTPSAAPHTT